MEIQALAIFSNDAAILSNMSACYARLDDGITAHDYSTFCMYERPEWPNAYYRYDDAADAFLEGLTLDPGNKELKIAYMKSVEARLNFIKV
ncbi:hypothetical protein MKX01_026680 [Papaver californicum]|nr:hypothetical protein MKX01_026680 [Papaver californicum]